MDSPKIRFSPRFLIVFAKLKDETTKTRVRKQIEKIIAQPEVGKPMRNARKGTREGYVSPYRLSYEYLPGENAILILDFYHKDEQ